MKKLLVAFAVAAVLAGVGACGGSSTVSATTLLSDAQKFINGASSAHFVLTSQGIPASGTYLRGGTGDLARPDKLQGSFDVQVFGLPATVKAIAVGGTFWVLLPFQPSYKVVNPKQFGLGDPALLINQDTGVTRLLTELQNPKATGQERVNGELLEKVTGTVTGPQIDIFLPDAKPSEPVDMTFAINPSNHQVRQVVVTGPLVSASAQSSYIVTLTNYNEPVTIKPPA